MRVHALNRGHILEHPFSGMVHNIHEQPWNRLRIKRVHMGGSFSSDLTSVLQLPRRSGGVLRSLCPCDLLIPHPGP